MLFEAGVEVVRISIPFVVGVSVRRNGVEVGK
jgi:hypothetical protein